MSVCGVILAGGSGSRLGELTRVINKHLLPVGRQPMIYHPLEKLLGARISDVLLISGADSLGDFAALLGSGREFGCQLSYRAQDNPGGIAQALALAENFRGNARLAVLLGDNVFFDPLGPLLERAAERPQHAWLALKQVPDPQRYGIAELLGGEVVAIDEKPEQPKSDWAVAGIYLYPPDVFDLIRQLRPGPRGELEITDLNRLYLARGRLSHFCLDGYWTDAGTPESLELANRLVHEQPPRF